MATALDPGDFASQFYHLGINKNYVIGYSVMLLYDHVLTLDNEVDLIWQRRFTLPTYLFFIFRYATPIVCIINLIAEHDPTWTGTRCSRWIWLPVAIGPIIAATTGIILILRIHALCNRALWVLYITIPVYIVQIAIMLWSIPAGTVAQFPPGFVGCVASEKQGTIGRLTASYIAGFVFDLIIFLLTLSRAIHLRLLSARIPLVSLILRDGVMYFFALLVVNLVNVSVIYLAPTDLSGPNARFSNLITATLVARLMLNLRAASTRTYQVHASSYSSAGRHISTLADIGNWISTPGSISESVFGMSEFDSPLGDGYEGTGSRGTDTGSSMTAVMQANAYGRQQEFDFEMQNLEHGKSSPRSMPRDDG